MMQKYTLILSNHIAYTNNVYDRWLFKFWSNACYKKRHTVTIKVYTTDSDFADTVKREIYRHDNSK